MSTRVLVSLLGSTRDGDYTKTRYVFTDGDEVETSTITGALVGWHRRRRGGLHSAVVVGTRTSMWEALAEMVEAWPGQSALQEEIMDARLGQGVSDELLASWQEELSGYLGLPLTLLAIPECEQEEEQVQVIAALSDNVPQGHDLVLDITHGFRHLSVLLLAAARYLQAARSCRLEEVYYGKFHGPGEPAKVLPITGARTVLGLAEDMAAHRATGAFQPLARSLGDALPGLEEAAFFIDTQRPHQRRRQLLQVLEALKADHLPPRVEVARHELKDLLQGLSSGNLEERQLNLARHALQAENYTSAVLVGFESMVTAASRHLLPPASSGSSEHERREEGRKLLHQALRDRRSQSPEDWERYRNLTHIRNAIAHGAPSQRKPVQQAMNSPETLHAMLRELLDWLPTLYRRMDAGELS